MHQALWKFGKLKMGKTETDPISMNSGLGQGDSMTSVLFYLVSNRKNYKRN